MLAASFFSLIIPGLEAAGELHGGSKWIAALIVCSAVLVGAGTLHLFNRIAPHEHFISRPRSGAERSRLSRIWLFIIAISLHTFPEGLAVAISLAAVGYSPLFSFLVAVLTGLIEPVGGFSASALCPCRASSFRGASALRAAP